MTEADDARGRNWFARRMVSTSDLADWSVDQWREWFADGLDVWFSQAAAADRELAFAPLRITLGRAEMAEAVAAYLQRFYRLTDKTEASRTMNIMSSIENAAAQCLRSSVIVKTAERAQFLLEVFQLLQARRLPLLAKLSLQTLPVDVFGTPAGDEYLSFLTYVIFDNSILSDGDPLQQYLETRLRHCLNYRPSLIPSFRCRKSGAEDARV